MELLQQLPWILAGVVLLIYAGVPLFVFMSIRLPGTDMAREVGGAIEPDAQKYFDQVARNLADEGFKRSRPMIVRGPSPMLAILLHSPRTQDVCVAFTIYKREQASRVVAAQSVEFMTWFEDGTRILTSAHADSAAFGSNPALDLLVFESVTSVSLLQRIHRRRVEQHPRRNLARRVPEPGNEAAFVSAASTLHMEQQLETGLARRVGTDFGLSLRGAFVLTWRQLPPFAQIAKSRRKARARVALVAMKFDPTIND